MLLYHTLRQLSTEDADCCRFALPHRRPSGADFPTAQIHAPLPEGLSFPAGEGGKKESKRQGRQATKKISLPASTTAARSTGNAGASPPPGAWFAPFSSAARVLPRGCKGRSPLHEITLNLPLPHRGRGVGGWAEAKLKAGQAGDQKDKPPCEYHSGKVNRQRRGQAPPGAGDASSQRRPGSAPGDARGGAPCMK